MLLPLFSIIAAATLGAQTCPVEFVKTTTGLNAASSDYWVEVTLRNISGKEIRGIKLVSAYFDALEDISLYAAIKDGKPMPPATGPKAKNRKYGIPIGNFKLKNYPEDAKGWIVIPVKILFEDGSTWEEPLRTPGCWGEFWKDKNHPRLSKLPPDKLAELDKFDGRKVAAN